MNIPTIKYVEALPNFQLFLIFDNGTIKVYDMHELISLPAFESLKYDNLFFKVKVDAGGFGLSWNDELDISEYECWRNGREVATINGLVTHDTIS